MNFACTKNAENPIEFIKRTKNKDINMLFNVLIDARNSRNDTLRYYYSHTIMGIDTLTIPSFEYFDELYKNDTLLYTKVFEKLSQNEGNNEIEPKIFAKNYASKLQTLYNELKVANISSKPNFGRFIEFTLVGGCKVYYLQESKSLNSYWLGRFKKFKNVDNKWYYECSRD